MLGLLYRIRYCYDTRKTYCVVYDLNLHPLLMSIVKRPLNNNCLQEITFFKIKVQPCDFTNNNGEHQFFRRQVTLQRNSSLVCISIARVIC